MTAYCDSHAHLTYTSEVLPGIESALDAAYKESSAIVLDVGVDYDDFPARVKRFGYMPYIRFSAGIWPDARSSLDARLSELETHMRHPRCAALGECGFDYHWVYGSAEEQRRLFEAQLELAVKYGKALIVHSRDAHEDTLRVVRGAARAIPVMIHCFSYDTDAALRYIAEGCYISFAGNITYKKNDALRAALLCVPKDKLLLETDAPYMNPMPRRGKDSSPLDIERTYAYAAQLCNEPVAQLADRIKNNLRRFLSCA